MKQRTRTEAPKTAWWRGTALGFGLTLAIVGGLGNSVIAVASEQPSSPDDPTSVPSPPSLESLAITVTADHPREFIYTDKGAAHLAGEAVGTDTRSYHGFYIAMHERMDGWALRLEDGTVIGPATAVSAEVRPDYLVRRHELPGGVEVTETVTLFDNDNGFRVVYGGVPPGGFELLPRIDMRFLWRVGKPGYAVEWRDGVLLVARQDRQESTREELPAWLGIAVTGAQGFHDAGLYIDTVYPKGVARRAMANASPYVPGAIWGRIPRRIPSGRVEMVVAAGFSAGDALERAQRLRRESFELLQKRQQRLEDLLEKSLILTGVERDDRALAWARISLDNLIMNQRGVGIYAGFYWFTTYWGRDSFITLPGACLVNGDWETAETVLRSFASPIYQDRDPDSPREGRLPNFVTVEQVQYGGVDGTWWFVRALDELWKRSGHDEFAREMTPAVIWAVEGALRHAVDEYGFLKHGDGETWMDAGGEANPYSPRGDRAVEVQALFHRGLVTAARLVERFGTPVAAPEDASWKEADYQHDLERALGRAPVGLGADELAARYLELAGRLAGHFREQFWVDGRLVDHLDRDGGKDRQVRPNGLLAILSSPGLFSVEERESVVTLAAEQLVKPWGVISLTEEDPFFHPKHLDLGKYYYDEAYHNGDLWLWLSGPYVSALRDPRAGFGQTRMLLDEILGEGAVGTLQEIRDGAEVESNDEFGGATSQAWSLAELLRNVVEDYLGLEVDLTAQPPRVVVSPTLPEVWPGLEVRTQIGEVGCLVRCGCGKAAEGAGTDVGGGGGYGGRQEGERWLELWFDLEPPEEWVISAGWGGEVEVEGLNLKEWNRMEGDGRWPVRVRIISSEYQGGIPR